MEAMKALYLGVVELQQFFCKICLIKFTHIYRE